MGYKIGFKIFSNEFGWGTITDINKEGNVEVTYLTAIIPEEVKQLQAEEHRIQVAQLEHERIWLKEKHEKEQSFIVENLRRMGFDNTWIPSYNIERNGLFVLNSVTDINSDDFLWLCHRVAKLYSTYSTDCVDNFRLSRATMVFKKPSLEYEETRNNGCCEFYDKLIKNPKTNNYFWIGCNYGH